MARPFKIPLVCDRGFRLLSLLGAVVAVILVLLTVGDVLGRNVFNHPIPGAYQLTELGMGCVIFLIMPQITYEQRHLCMGALERCLPVRLRMHVDIFHQILLAAVFLLLAWRLWLYAAQRAAFGETIGTFELHTAPFFFLFGGLAAASALASVLPRHGPTSDSEQQR